MADLVIVSNRLPVSVRKTDGRFEYYQSLGGLATGLANYTKRPGTRWIGWPGIAVDELTEAEKAQITRELKKQRCYPLWLTQSQLDDYYGGYSNSVLWPLFHDLPVGTQRRKWWRAYRQVNELFAAETLRLSRAGDTIWVHDYQLALMPELLRREQREARIGYFLHIPFPPVKIFESLSEAKRLLGGMLGADLAGFHTGTYARNFLQACDRLLSTGQQHDFVHVGARTVRVTEFPMGIDYARFAEATRQPQNAARLRELQARYRGQRVILTVDRLDPSKGLPERLQAYAQLLRERPALRGQITMVMIVAPSRTDLPEYRALKRQLDRLLRDILREFGTADWQPVDFIYEAVPLETVTLYYRIADVAFITPLRDGMNLVAKEYLASRPSGSGALILSETAGAAEELQDAIQVNPTRPAELVRALSRALDLPRSELSSQVRRMQRHIQQFTVQQWAASFMDALHRPISLPRVPARALTERRADTMLADYRRAGKRLLLLDYDGTLRSFVNDPMAAKPTPEIRRLLRRLGSNPANDVVIVTGRGRENVLNWFGRLPLALAAEHGAYFRRKGGKHWHRTSTVSDEWKRPVLDLFNYYANVTPGALVEQKRAATVWHYRAATPYNAQKSLVGLRRLIRPIAKRYGLTVKEGNKILEVHPRDISKGRAAEEWLIHDHDFVLAIGDDRTDEDMFAVLPPTAYSIKVGRGVTAARFRVKDVAAVLELLGRF